MSAGRLAIERDQSDGKRVQLGQQHLRASSVCGGFLGEIQLRRFGPQHWWSATAKVHQIPEIAGNIEPESSVLG